MLYNLLSSERPRGRRLPKGVPLMALEILGALAALASIGSFVLEVCREVRLRRERESSRRMAREEELRQSPENK